MPLRTTVIGSYPKPAYLELPDWFSRTAEREYCADSYTDYTSKAQQQELVKQIDKAVEDTVAEQVSAGIDVITDGEIPRENYVFHFCRHLENFDFSELTFKVYRNGACRAHLPTVRGKLSTRAADVGWTVAEWRSAQRVTDAATVKYTLPGPMTITNTTSNAYYPDMRSQFADLVPCINAEVRALAAAGCRHIQIDEPLLVRQPDIALEFGIEYLARCFEGVGPEVTKAIHLCCGYPRHLDQENYPKADKDAYITIAEKLDDAGFDAISIEDAHRRNDLELFSKFKKSAIILGCVKIASSEVETVEDIVARTRAVLRHIPAERLWLAPDCGLGFLPAHLIKTKLSNMVAAAKQLP